MKPHPAPACTVSRDPEIAAIFPVTEAVCGIDIETGALFGCSLAVGVGEGIGVPEICVTDVALILPV